MFEDEDTIVLIYGLICLGVGSVCTLLGIYFAPTFEYGFGITGSHHYRFLPTGCLYLLGGSFLIGGIAAPFLFLIIKLGKKLTTT